MVGNALKRVSGFGQVRISVMPELAADFQFLHRRVQVLQRPRARVHRCRQDARSLGKFVKPGEKFDLTEAPNPAQQSGFHAAAGDFSRQNYFSHGQPMSQCPGHAGGIKTRKSFGFCAPPSALAAPAQTSVFGASSAFGNRGWYHYNR
jgi:hypothetical protein